MAVRPPPGSISRRRAAIICRAPHRPRWPCLADGDEEIRHRHTTPGANPAFGGCSHLRRSIVPDMTEPPIVVRRDGCTFCCLPLLLVLGSLGLAVLVALAALLLQ